jgi:predicted phage tail protein
MRIPTARRAGAVPFADLARVSATAQRTSIVRILLAAALVATLVWLFVDARSAGAGRAAVFPQGATTGVVLLDMSASISGPIYARVATTLRGIVAANQSVGFVMFSDTAYELLPPNSPPAAMLAFVPFFQPLRYYGSTPVFGQTPWDTFTGGTRVGAGLEVAASALRRAKIRHGAILLVSDLDDANADQSLLEQEALKLRTEHIPVRIVPLFAASPDKALFASLFGDNAFVDPHVFTHTAKRHAASVTAPQPWLLLLLGAALVLLLAGNERWNARLELQEAT